MLHSTDRIRTTHAGSLPRTPALLEANQARSGVPDAEHDRLLQDSVVDVVRRQDELVADRIERFARQVGRENVIASTDCGLGGRIHPQIAWAKLETLARGAELASRRLWS